MTDKILNAAKVRVNTLKSIAFNKLRLYVLEVLATELHSFDGKKITVKLANRMRETFPDYTFHLDDMKETHRYLRGWCWINNSNTDICSAFIGTGRGTFSGVNSTECFNYNEWYKENSAVEHLREYIERMEAALVTLDAVVDTYNTALEAFEQAKEHLRDLPYSD